MSEAMTSYPRYVVKLKLVDVSGRWNNDSFTGLFSRAYDIVWEPLTMDHRMR